MVLLYAMVFYWFGCVSGHFFLILESVSISLVFYGLTGYGIIACSCHILYVVVGHPT